MPLRDLLKGLSAKLGLNIEGDLIKYEPTQSGGSQVKKIKARTVIIGDVYVLDPSATERILRSSEPEKVQDLVQMDQVAVSGFTRADLAGHDMVALNSQEENRYILQGLKDIIGPLDLVALSAAMTIRKYELLGQGPKAGELRRSLRTRFGERGNRIYVFYSSGLLQEFMEPLIDWITYSGTWSDKIAAKELWNACLDHMDYAVYVNARMSEDDVVSEISIRFRVAKVACVLVFGRTDRINAKVRRSVKRFLDEESEYQQEIRHYEVREKEYQVGDHVALVIVVEREESSCQ